ncbi:MAG: dockerin type I repeat-containing protein, partial [Lachnospiraceae bacterium]|nr:dockerin type I repeat-containing protein [Lachnospiraceae bacterium]
TYEIEFKNSAQISEKTGVATYVALVDASVAMENFVNESYFDIPGEDAETISFGDVNGDGVVNAQDALAAVDAWLRKGEEPTDDQILTMNVNGDRRINTFDALGIVEAFVNGAEYGVVTKAATISSEQ